MKFIRQVDETQVCDKMSEVSEFTRTCAQPMRTLRPNYVEINNAESSLPEEERTRDLQ